VKARFDEVGLTLGPPSGQELSGSVSVDVDERTYRDEADGR
jgi:hypothetical protein